MQIIGYIMLGVLMILSGVGIMLIVDLINLIYGKRS